MLNVYHLRALNSNAWWNGSGERAEAMPTGGRTRTVPQLRETLLSIMPSTTEWYRVTRHANEYAPCRTALSSKLIHRLLGNGLKHRGMVGLPYVGSPRTGPRALSGMRVTREVGSGGRAMTLRRRIPEIDHMLREAGPNAESAMISSNIGS